VQCQCSPPHAFPYCRTSNFAKPKGNYTPKERSTSQEKTRSRQGQDQGLLTAPVLDWTGLDWTGQLSAQTHSIVFNLTSPHLTSHPSYNQPTISSINNPSSSTIPSAVAIVAQPHPPTSRYHHRTRPAQAHTTGRQANSRQDLTVAQKQDPRSPHCIALHCTRTALLHPRCVIFGRPTCRLRLDLINKPSSSSFPTTTLDLSGLPAVAVKRPRPQHRTMVAGPSHWR